MRSPGPHSRAGALACTGSCRGSARGCALLESDATQGRLVPAKASTSRVKNQGRAQQAPEVADRTAELIILGLLVYLASVVVVPGILGPSMLPKLTIAIIGTGVCVGIWAARGVFERRLELPWGRVLAPVAFYAAALVAVTAMSSNRHVSVLGVFERWTGLVPYLTYLVLFLVVVVLGRRAVVPVSVALLSALGTVVAYAMLQVIGVDPMDWQDVAMISADGRTPVFSLFGNVNFASGWTGAVIPLVLWATLRAGDSRMRAALIALLVGVVVLLWQAGSSQGPIAAAAGTTLFLGTWATQLPREGRAGIVRRWLPKLAAAGGALAVLMVGVFVALSPDGGTRQRLHFWETAFAIFADHPIVGTGLDTYGGLFSSYRSAEAAALYGFERNDAPHSVPLGMLSNGGLLLGLAYLAFVVIVGVVLARGLRRLDGDDRVLLAAFGGVWLAYQVQSLVSFDVPPVALLHYLSASVIVVLASPVPITRVVELPGFRKRARQTRKGRALGPSGRDLVWVGVVVVVVGALVLFASRPLRADLAVGSAAPLLEQNRGPEALERIERGIELAPYEPRYRELYARLLMVAREEESALANFAEAARLDPGSVDLALSAAELAEALGQDEVAERWYTEAVSRDPNNAAVLSRASRFALSAGDPERSRALADQAVQLGPGVESLLLLAQSAADLGRTDEASKAFKRVLALEPGNEDAQSGLQRLEGGS